MNEKKLERAAKCLYAVSAIQAASSVYGFLTLQAYKDFASGITSGLSLSVLSGSMFFSATIVVASLITAKKLREQKSWAWIAANSLFLFTLPSFALPASVLGILSLMDIEVRTFFINDLDIKL